MIDVNNLSQPQKARSPFKRIVKNLLVLTACIGIGAGAGWALSETQSEKWRATAQFDLPTIQELGNYYALASTYALVKGESIADFDKGLSEKSYLEFKRHLNSPDVLKQFLQEKNSKAAESAFQFNEKQQRLNVTLDNPELAYKLLNEFIQFANLRSKNVLNGELIEKWKVLFQQVKNASEANLGAIQSGAQIATQDWNGKLKLMKSVQPLDDKLIAYRLIESPSIPQNPYSPDKLLWLMIGGMGGLLLGLFAISLQSLYRKS